MYLQRHGPLGSAVLTVLVTLASCSDNQTYNLSSQQRLYTIVKSNPVLMRSDPEVPPVTVASSTSEPVVNHNALLNSTSQTDVDAATQYIATSPETDDSSKIEDHLRTLFNDTSNRSKVLLALAKYPAQQFDADLAESTPTTNDNLGANLDQALAAAAMSGGDATRTALQSLVTTASPTLFQIRIKLWKAYSSIDNDACPSDSLKFYGTVPGEYRVRT